MKMSEWEIKMPWRLLDEPLNAKSIWELPDALTDREEKAVCRELLIGMHMVGARRVREVTLALEELSATERRLLLDGLRRRAGLKTATQIDHERRFEAANEAGAARARSTSPWALCAEPSCNRIPFNEVGVPVASTVNRWWCPEHAHLAQPGDLDERQLPIRLSPAGVLVEYDPAADEADRARERSRQVELEARLAEAEADAAPLREHEDARAEELRRLQPPGVSA